MKRDGETTTEYWLRRIQTDARAPLIVALEEVLNEYDRNVCEHEITHRGGAIWTICDGCGRKWADDEGGFQPHRDPPSIVEARKALSQAKGTDQ